MLKEDLVAPDVSVVIVNHNAGSWLLRSVTAALAQVAQVIVVDNASHDDSLVLLDAHFVHDERVVVIRAQHNQGFAMACNQGARASNSSFVLFLNPDCILNRDAILHLLDVMKQNADIGMVGGLLTDEAGVEQRGGRRSIPSLRQAMLNISGLSRFFGDFNLHLAPMPSEPAEIEAISGAMMFVRRVVLEAVGGFDEGYFLHCEDLDLCMRIRAASWKIFFVPKAVAVHEQGICSRSRPLFVSWNKHKGMIRFYRKFYQKRYSIALMWSVTFGVYLHFCLIVMRHGLLRSLKLLS